VKIQLINNYQYDKEIIQVKENKQIVYTNDVVENKHIDIVV
jgi:hypothetical protein